ncbi:MAG TPA: penicillin-binding transpeptidase domain-containing protein [Polyangiaceae bacterium]
MSLHDGRSAPPGDAASNDVVYAPLRTGGRAQLTLDPWLQRRAERLLTEAEPLEAAAVVIDARSAKVRVWAHTGHSSRILTQSTPSASVFKLVTTTALLERTNVTPSTRVCTWGGKHAIERRHLERASGPNAQCAPFFFALGHSKNAVFAQLATRYLMRTDLIEVGDRFGFNRPVPFEAPVPMGTLEVPYNDLEFARTAAGFRGTSLSPLGAAYLAYIVASRGNALALRIVEQAPNYLAKKEPELVRQVMRPSTARHLIRMMEVTVSGGTSLEAFSDKSGQSYLGPVRVAGKTGTLPDVRSETASWFTGFAPSRDPEVVVSVLLKNGRVWHRKANEVARDLLRAYFHRRGVRRVTDPFGE